MAQRGGLSRTACTQGAATRASSPVQAVVQALQTVGDDFGLRAVGERQALCDGHGVVSEKAGCVFTKSLYSWKLSEFFT